MLIKLREKVGMRTIPAESRYRGRIDYPGFEAVRSVGIVFNASHKEEFELVKKYVRYLREFPKKVKAIGYFPDNRMPEMTYSKLEYDFFTAKDLDVLRRPKIPVAKNFIEEEFDVLIDMNLSRLFPLYYITALSNARLKIGVKHQEQHPVHDLMIEMEPEKGLKYFLRFVDQYLDMLGPGKTTPKEIANNE